MMITVAITGGYATGKSVVANMFARLGAEVLSADKIAHIAMRPHTPVWKEIVGYFGRDILKKDDQIDRRKLAKIVFSDKRRLKRLNEIVHPFVIEELKRIIQDKVTKYKIGVFVIEIPLLFETGLESWFTKNIVVLCNKTVQVERAKRRDKISNKELLLRIKSQWSIAKKKKLANFIVDNSGTRLETKRQAAGIWEVLWKKER